MISDYLVMPNKPALGRAKGRSRQGKHPGNTVTKPYDQGLRAAQLPAAGAKIRKKIIAIACNFSTLVFVSL
jgi:hypothetical protein